MSGDDNEHKEPDLSTTNNNYSKYQLGVVQKWNKQEHGENAYLETKLKMGYLVHFTMDDAYDDLEQFLNEYYDFKNIWMDNSNVSETMSDEYAPKLALLNEFEFELYSLGFDRGYIITKFKKMWKKYREKIMFYKHPRSILYREIHGTFPKIRM
jgi:hypothetical protein